MYIRKGCVGSTSVLRPFPNYGRHTLQETEKFYEFQEAVQAHSIRLLSGEDACGRYACGACRYVVTKGALGTRPQLDAVHVVDVVDRCFADCVLYALDVANTTSVFIIVNAAASRGALRLKSKVVAPLPTVPGSRVFPVDEVFKARANLAQQSDVEVKGIFNKTVQSRLGPVLASKNVHL